MSRRLKAFLFPAIALAGVAAFAFADAPAETEAEYALGAPPELVAATFASAWCSSCKILKPRLAGVIPEFRDRPVRFVELDFTFGQHEENERRATEEGLGEAYKRFKGATGFTLLIDAETGEIVDSLTMNHSKDAMRAAIAAALATAEREPS